MFSSLMPLSVPAPATLASDFTDLADKYRYSVVRILAVYKGRDIFRPYKTASVHKSVGSGFVLEGGALNHTIIVALVCAPSRY